MAKEEEREPFNLSPLSFFQYSLGCRFLDEKNKFLPEGKFLEPYLLPETTLLSGESPFAQVAMGWNREGLAFTVEAKRPTLRCSFPQITKGDSVELFIDTRDMKTTGHNTRFCHHFFFLPEAIEGHSRGELTHFRSEEAHPLCDSSLLQLEVKNSAKGYCLKIFIPTQCLHSYDPEEFPRCGFTYRINRFNGEPQNFSASSADYAIEQQPSLWSSVSFLP